ncbi:hypothetical protein Q1695_014585 [Nippostrongylus brasiliensis]|nr:hypothetical protein Q1695_014585 [Nippostrongylus brasiliensis]
MSSAEYVPLSRRGGRNQGLRGRQSTNRQSPWHDVSVDGEDKYGNYIPVSESPKTTMAAVFRSNKRKREKVLIDNSHFESMPMCGIEVRLPPGLKPYPSQKLMMVRMITSISKRLNLLAESPTGSGKTLALLASSCAWLDDYRKKRQDARTKCPVHGENAALDSSTLFFM